MFASATDVLTAICKKDMELKVDSIKN